MPTPPPSVSPVGWLILFHSCAADHEWEWVGPMSREQAIDKATMDRRHQNYGRNGYTLIEAEEPKPIDPLV
jgi:hypothetical protein